MLSFIIPAYNEERELPATLAAIHKAASATGEPYEIIVANDNSDDRTADIGREHGAIVTTVEHRQISATRNSGAREASGEIFFFIDADTRANPDAVCEAIDVIQRGAAGGGAIMVFDGETPLYADIMLPIFNVLFRVLKFTGGAFMFCRRDVFESIGGFDERVYASEEAAFAMGIKRHGRFVVLDKVIETSGRKLRMLSGWTIFAAAFKLGIPGAVRKRSPVWYDGRREQGE